MEPAHGIQGWVMDVQMDARLKCSVEVTDAVESEEHYTSVIFELPQKDRDETIAPYVVVVRASRNM